MTNELGNDHLWAVRLKDGRPVEPPISLVKGIPHGTPLTITADGSFILSIPGVIKPYTADIDPQTGAATSRTELTPDALSSRDAAWSPDGQRLVYSAIRDLDAPSTDLYLREAGSGQDRLIGTVRPFARTLAWTPDGKALLLAQPTDRGIGAAIVRYWLEERRSEILVAAEPGDPPAKAFPKLDREGRFLYYAQGAGSGIDASVMQRDLVTGRSVQVAVTSATNFDVAPDGEQLVLQYLDPASRQIAIRVIRRDGQFVRDLTRLSADERVASLAWSADGQWIYFTRAGRDDATIYRVAAAGGVPTSTGLTINMANAGEHLMVHPSGRQIAFMARTEPELWRVDGLATIAARTQMAR